MRFWENDVNLSCRDKEIYRFYYDFIKSRLRKIEESDNVVIGYEVLGPLLLGFCQYLRKQFKTDKIEKAFFLSRDGLLIKKAYEILFPNESINLQYLYVSRHAITIPLLSYAKNFDDIIHILLPFLHIPNMGTIREICGIDKEIFDNTLSELGYSEVTKVDNIKNEHKEIFFNLIMELKSAYYKIQKKFFNQYLKESEFIGNIGVIDIGWNGTIQKSLNRYINNDETHIIGYYLGVRNMAADSYYQESERRGYLFDLTNNNEYSMMTRFTAEVFDNLFLGITGTVRGYKLEDGRIEPVLGECEYKYYESLFVNKYQSFALSFLRDYRNYYSYDTYDVSPDVIMSVYKKFAVYPTAKTLRLFSNFYMSDGNVMKKMLPEHTLFYYFFHFKQLKKELNMNMCKVWFLKWLFKIPFPYYRLLRALADSGFKSEFQQKMIRDTNK